MLDIERIIVVILLIDFAGDFHLNFDKIGLVENLRNFVLQSLAKTVLFQTLSKVSLVSHCLLWSVPKTFSRKIFAATRLFTQNADPKSVAIEILSFRAKVNIFLSFFSQQKKKRQSAYNGIRYDKLDGQKNSTLEAKSTKLLIAADDIELTHDSLQKAYEELHAPECENDDDYDEDEMDEETRFINKNRSSFYTSSERTWTVTVITTNYSVNFK